MAGKAKYLMIASMDVDAEHDAIFNEVYDQEHVPNLLMVPGVLGVSAVKNLFVLSATCRGNCRAPAPVI